MTYCLFSCLTHFLNTFTPFFIPFVCSISEFELFQRMLHTNVWLKSPFYVRFVHLICKNQQEKPNAAGHPERPLDFPSKRSLNLHAPLRRLFAVLLTTGFIYYPFPESISTVYITNEPHWPAGRNFNKGMYKSQFLVAKEHGFC